MHLGAHAPVVPPNGPQWFGFQLSPHGQPSCTRTSRLLGVDVLFPFYVFFLRRNPKPPSFGIELIFRCSHGWNVSADAIKYKVVMETFATAVHHQDRCVKSSVRGEMSPQDFWNLVKRLTEGRGEDKELTELTESWSDCGRLDFDLELECVYPSWTCINSNFIHLFLGEVGFVSQATLGAGLVGSTK